MTKHENGATKRGKKKEKLSQMKKGKKKKIVKK